MKTTTIAYVGDPVSAAGFRLAGARIWSPPAGGEAAALAQARRAAKVVLLAEEVGAAIAPAELDAAFAALQPLVAIVPRAGGGVSAVDPAERVRVQLGLER